MTNLKNLLLENYSKYFDDLLSGERSLPFGLLVYYKNCLKKILLISLQFVHYESRVASIVDMGLSCVLVYLSKDNNYYNNTIQTEVNIL